MKSIQIVSWNEVLTLTISVRNRDGMYGDVRLTQMTPIERYESAFWHGVIVEYEGTRFLVRDDGKVLSRTRSGLWCPNPSAEIEHIWDDYWTLQVEFPAEFDGLPVEQSTKYDWLLTGEDFEEALRKHLQIPPETGFHVTWKYHSVSEESGPGGSIWNSPDDYDGGGGAASVRIREKYGIFIEIEGPKTLTYCIYKTTDTGDRAWIANALLYQGGVVFLEDTQELGEVALPPMASFPCR